ncbi:putative lipid-A-disaccharide synthase [Thalassoporum mexicanum PCC 7367]|uniref:lipid-A-disaccharide synthase n=1 Tax=Thalassoporum mexicanum TaxID=3457544 RepID=UPI00029F95D5|nr:lipid-A-disaccharide synthase [Pseudanabaena sp. PCC 7367]AFY68616.1 putative lipid-A-disaccharide synthase [Pseudanabaena sp. PCC 7367]
MDLVILTNGPGELTTWVYPVLARLSQRWRSYKSTQSTQSTSMLRQAEVSDDLPSLRISVVLSPCSHASGQEAAIAQTYPGVDRVLSADRFMAFLLRGKTPDPNWDWHQRGVVVFLGGDQIFPVIIAKRLGYAAIVYAEWEARWLGWVDHFAVRNQQVAAAIPARHQQKISIVGDLMVDRQVVAAPTVQGNQNNLDLSSRSLNPEPGVTQPDQANLIVFMPGSKSMKLQQGVPLCLGIADRLAQQYPALKFAIALAPTLSAQQLSTYAQPSQVVDLVAGSTAQLSHQAQKSDLITLAGTKVEIYTQFPAHDLLQRATLCLTTVGANTAQLAALAVPMVVLLPTNQLDAMRAWDGLWGLLANLPLLGGSLAKLINRIVLLKLDHKHLAWPNIWAGAEVVPERVGYLTPELVVEQTITPLLENPARLVDMRAKLRSLCGEPGAADRIVDLIGKYLNLTI